jgi:anaerobic selenocysteine-containing dehydrogenase
MTELKSQTTHYHACNLCEAICGLEIVLEDEQIISIKGDKKDPLSKGHICPKAIALQDIYNDPDRLRQPHKKTADGWEKISWDQAYDEVAQNLKKIQKKYGNNAVGVYQGNPTVHNLEAMLFSSAFTRTLRTQNHFSATSVDQLPEQLVSSEMFGHSLLIPLPDLDRTEFVIIIGGNPVVSNGSLMTAPGVKKRLTAISERGGKVVVIDPRKTETAAIADEHFFVKPGTDALMMLAMLQYLFEQKLQSLGTVSNFTKDLKIVEKLVKPYTPEIVSPITGIPAERLKELVRNFCVAGSATCYGRIGVSTHEYGTLTQWLIVVFNIVTGNLDFPGGTMFSNPAFDFLAKTSKKSSSKKKKRKDFGSAYSRVRNLPNFNGEFPVATLAEEITTAGEGQIKAMVTNSGNPLLSTPNSKNIDQAFSQLEYMVSIDFFINETTRHANIILPPVSALERPHYDIIFHSLAIQNTARFSTALFKPPKDARSDAQIFTELGWRMTSVSLFSKMKGWFKKTLTQKLGAEYVINDQLKKGPYGKSHNLTLQKLLDNPHGIDLGALTPCLPNRLFTKDKQINLAPAIFVKDLERLQKQYLMTSQSKDAPEFDLLLIGRRDPRTNNSWLHNSYRMVKGKNRCLAMIHPDDATARNIEDGELVHIKSRVGAINITVVITDEMMPGVISIPHGWGHDMDGVELRVAKEHGGVNTNILTDEFLLDAISGNAALNGVPISISRIQ